MRLACTTAASVAVVLIVLDDVIVWVLRTLSSTFPCPFLPALLPRSATIFAPQTSTLYSILGMTTLLKSRQENLFLIPRDGLARCWQARVYFVPLVTALASCSLNWSSSSIMTPRNLCDLMGCVVWPVMVVGIHFFGMVFLGFVGYFSLLQDT